MGECTPKRERILINLRRKRMMVEVKYGRQRYLGEQETTEIKEVRVEGEEQRKQKKEQMVI
jgi:hypothetical protein